MKKVFICFILFLFCSSYAKERTTEQTVIKSNKMNRDQNNVITAIGDVEMKKGNKIFSANELEYNQNTKIIKANSSVKAYDELENNMYFAEEAEVSDDFMNGKFYNGIILFNNGSNISSKHIIKSGHDIFTKSTTTYDVCPTNIFDLNLTYEQLVEDLEKHKTPLFSLRSTKIKLDNDKKVLKLWNNTVWIWKIPIFYIPYLKTGLVFEKDVNGFDTPGIENTNHYGYGIYIPYKIREKNYNLTITPKVYQKGNYLANIKYNVNSSESGKWKININTDIVNDNGQSKNLKNAYGISEKDSDDYKKWRGYASLNSHYSFNELWTFENNAAIASDRYFLRDYYRDNLSYIQSNFAFYRVNTKDITNFNYLEFSNLFYQELLERIQNQQTPKYVPVLNINLQNTISKTKTNNLFYKLKLNTTNIFRTRGVEYNRITFIPSINDTFKTKFGTINLNFDIRGDLYALNEVGMEREKIYEGAKSRVLPELNIEWRKAFIFKYFDIQPILKYSGTTNSEDFENKIPNEDSKPQFLNFENIFANNRFSGYDREEYGNRITYGFEGTILKIISFGIAQGYRDNIDDNINKYIIGFNKNLSDYVGYTNVIINNNFDITYSFLADKDNLKLQKNKVNLNFNTNNFNFYIGYNDMEPNILYLTRQQQINGGFELKFFKKWTIGSYGIVDLRNDDRLLDSGAFLSYNGGCTSWDLRYENYNPLSKTNRNISIDFSFRIKFL